MCDVTSSSCISNSCSDLLFFHLQYVSFIKELDDEVDLVSCRIFQNHMQQYFFTQVNHYSSENLLRNISLKFRFRNAVLIVKALVGWDCLIANLFEVDTLVGRLIAASVHFSILNLICCRVGCTATVHVVCHFYSQGGNTAVWEPRGLLFTCTGFFWYISKTWT